MTYSLFLYLILQILPHGAIAANWMMGGICAAFFFLLWQAWREVKSTMKNLEERQTKSELMHNDTAHILKSVQEKIDVLWDTKHEK